MKLLKLLCIIFLIPTFIISYANAKQIPPVDQCLSADGYYDFRQKLEKIVADRDSKALLGLIDDDIIWSFGGGEGKAGFIKAWNLNQSDTSFLWGELEKILPLGCAMNENTLILPYLSHADTGLNDAGFGHGVIIGNNVNVRKGPSIQFSIVTRYSWDVVKFIDYDFNQEWHKIELPNDKSGWVNAKFTRQLLDNRMGLEKKNGKWVIVFFIAGD